MYFDFANVLVFAGVAALTAGRVLRPHRPIPEKLATYECGEETIGSSWVQFNVRFYVIALVFLVFDVEIAVLFPWTAVFREAGTRLLAFLEIVLFLGILGAGYVYVWVKGDLEWLKSPGRDPGDSRKEGA